MRHTFQEHVALVWGGGGQKQTQQLFFSLVIASSLNKHKIALLRKNDAWVLWKI